VRAVLHGVPSAANAFTPLPQVAFARQGTSCDSGHAGDCSLMSFPPCLHWQFDVAESFSGQLPYMRRPCIQSFEEKNLVCCTSSVPMVDNCTALQGHILHPRAGRLHGLPLPARAAVATGWTLHSDCPADSLFAGCVTLLEGCVPSGLQAASVALLYSNFRLDSSSESCTCGLFERVSVDAVIP